MFAFSEIINMATQIEKNGERIYQAAIHHTHDRSLRELLQWMAEEEARHASWLGELAGESDLLVSDESLKKMNDALVRDYLKDQAFSLKDVDFSAITDTHELIRIFIEFEQDTIIFYDLLVAFVTEESVKNKIRTIIDEEENHVQKLRELIRLPSE